LNFRVDDLMKSPVLAAAMSAAAAMHAQFLKSGTVDFDALAAFNKQYAGNVPGGFTWNEVMSLGRAGEAKSGSTEQKSAIMMMMQSVLARAHIDPSYSLTLGPQAVQTTSSANAGYAMTKEGSVLVLAPDGKSVLEYFPREVPVQAPVSWKPGSYVYETFKN